MVKDKLTDTDHQTVYKAEPMKAPRSTQALGRPPWILLCFQPQQPG